MESVYTPMSMWNAVTLACCGLLVATPFVITSLLLIARSAREAMQPLQGIAKSLAEISHIMKSDPECDCELCSVMYEPIGPLDGDPNSDQTLDELDDELSGGDDGDEWKRPRKR